MQRHDCSPIRYSFLMQGPDSCCHPENSGRLSGRRRDGWSCHFVRSVKSHTLPPDPTGTFDHRWHASPRPPSPTITTTAVSATRPRAPATYPLHGQNQHCCHPSRETARGGKCGKHSGGGITDIIYISHCMDLALYSSTMNKM